MATSFNQLRAEAVARVGRHVGNRWHLKRLLGIGGMAAVYEATDTYGDTVALKIVHRQFSEDEEIIARCRREAEVVNHIGHPGVVPIHEVGSEGGMLFLVMELVTGRSLDFVRRALGGTLPMGCVRWAAEETLRVLAATHEKSVVHRDLKPANLFFTNEGTLRVLDFGIAKPIEAGMGITLHTTTGVLMGTPQFMSPEQARGRWRKVDRRSDLFSLGACLFMLASGRPVHEAANANEALGEAMTATARSITEVRPDIDADFAEVIDKALAFHPNDRWQTAEDMLAALTGKQFETTWKQTPSPEILAHLQGRCVLGKPAEAPARPKTAQAESSSTPSMDAVTAPSDVAMSAVAAVDSAFTATAPGTPHALNQLSMSTQHVTQMGTQPHSLLETEYWALEEDPDVQVVFLRRTPVPVTSTQELVDQNDRVIAKLQPKYKSWGVIVDVRLAPARNDDAFERAMRALRQELAQRFSRISVLVSSAVGKLQVSRIDRGDGKGTYVTQNESDAIHHVTGM